MTGSGTLADPYIIYNVNDLQAMGNNLTAYYELANNIDASATSGWNGGLGFVPIGTQASPFTGNLDGRGYIISNLFINRPATDYVGLFGLTSLGSSQKWIGNVRISEPNITGQEWVGALAGYLLGWATNKVSHCRVMGGEVHGDGRGTGGFAGQAGNIERSFSSGVDVYSGDCDASDYSDFYRVGGFAGLIVARIKNCYARNYIHYGTRNRKGGLAYDMSATGVVEKCYEASIPDAGVNYSYGLVMGYFPTPNSFWDGDLWGDETWRAAYPGGGTELTTAQAKTGSTYTDEGWDFDAIWNINPALNDGYPYLLGVTPSVVPPTVTTDAATAVGSGVSTPNGALDDDGGEACDCGFEWGETVAYGNTTPTQSRTTGQTFSQALAGLDPDTTYHFRAFATNSAGTSYGDDTTFTTDPPNPGITAPEVSTDEASEVGQELADLNLTLDDDGGEACECGFEWGRTTGYGSTTACENKVTGETFSQEISGLTPNTEYHFRAFATNSAGTSYGDDVMFTTQQRPLVNYRPIVNRSYALSRHEV